MKYLNLYEINDGIDGMILAKSLKQAVKIMVKGYNPCTINEMLNSIKNNEDFCLTDICKIPKCNQNNKSKVVGFCD